jgi:UDP-GlcNAc:undecaprenyl-phosphate/decaprenyl-phosphate GlcNAc-1-phosphate transferase
MTFWPPFLSGLVGMGVVFLLMPPVLRLAKRGRFGGQQKDLHHTHEAPVPRFGGLALAVAFLSVQVLITVVYPETKELARERVIILAGSLAMFVLGFWDDIVPIGAKKKLLGQILIALIVCSFGVGIQRFKIPFTGQIIDLHGWGVLATVIWLVIMTNLINLVDGVDGLAGGICLMLMSLLAYQGNSTLQFLAAGMAGALLGFLWFNFPPARVYLGDGGAYFLGFQIGLLSLASSQKGTIIAALVAPLFVLALPILDVALAILRRGLRGLPVFRPDRRHLHHHMMGMGLSRRKVVLSFYAVTLVFLVMGFAVFWSRGQLVPILLGVAVLLLLLCAGKLSFSREWFAVGKVLGNSLSMRQEVQYALVLIRWLSMEGSRRATIEGLWPDLVFVIQRLGFTGVKLTLADGERAWVQADIKGPTHLFQQQFEDGRCGTLELIAHASSPDDQNRGDLTDVDDEDVSCPCLADPKLFGIMTELVSEGWSRAIKRWEKSTDQPLSFSLRANSLGRRSKRPSVSSNRSLDFPKTLDKSLPAARSTVE